MYTKDTERSLAAMAKTLLSGKTPGSPEETAASLRQVIRHSDWRYYIQDDPVLSDQEYDQLFAQLKKLEEAHPSLVTADSPTQRVAQGLTKVFPTVQHLVPMLSLENSYDADDLIDWDRKAREISGLQE